MVEPVAAKYDSLETVLVLGKCGKVEPSKVCNVSQAISSDPAPQAVTAW